MLLGRDPFGAAAHHDPARQHAEQQRAVPEPQVAFGQCEQHERERAHQRHRAEDVHEQREVPVVRPDGGQHAHAPGFQTIVTSSASTTIVRIQCIAATARASSLPVRRWTL